MHLRSACSTSWRIAMLALFLIRGEKAAHAEALSESPPPFTSTTRPTEAAVRTQRLRADWRRQLEVRRRQPLKRALNPSDFAEAARRELQKLEDRLADDADTPGCSYELKRLGERLAQLTTDHPARGAEEIYYTVCDIRRRALFADPRLADIDHLLITKRAPGQFSHMSDQYYGWWLRPGGGLYVLENFKSAAPRLRCLTESLPAGSLLRPDLSYDGRRVLFAFARYYPHVAAIKDKTRKEDLPEDAFYHLYEVNVDGSGLKKLTGGKHDDFDGRYLPDEDIAFLSTRRGVTVQTQGHTEVCGAAEPDSYVRCGGDEWRPVAVYTLHHLDREEGQVRALSPFENFEWTPSVATDGRLLFSRWDYIDRDNMPYMSLWSTLPDGSGARAVYGNYTRNPMSMFEARSVPDSHKLVFTASAHHAITGGALMLVNPAQATDGAAALTRLTPEVRNPEAEGWPHTYFANPYPLGEDLMFVSWSDQPLVSQSGDLSRVNPVNAMGVYLFAADGSLELIHRDPAISTMCPLPLAPRQRPPVLRGGSEAETETPAASPPAGAFLLTDVGHGLPAELKRQVTRLRLVGIPPKAQPRMNVPPLGITRDDPGKFAIGTVLVEEDGSAHFLAPAGVPLFFQALDASGKAVQTMRSAAYVQRGETMTCVGCHEPRLSAPPNARSLAALRAPSKWTPPPPGAWPLDYKELVQPVLEAKCVVCHRPEGDAPEMDLREHVSYVNLTAFGGAAGLRGRITADYHAGQSVPGQTASRVSPLVKLLEAGHEDVELSADEWERLLTWIDLYGQRYGHFSLKQAEELRQLRREFAECFAE